MRQHRVEWRSGKGVRVQQAGLQGLIEIIRQLL